MPLSADTLLDRIHLKNQIKRWRMAAIVFGLLMFIVAIETVSPNSAMEKEFVARIAVEGIITDDQDMYELIDKVAKNPKAKAAIIWLDTPGGSAVGGEELYLKLRELSAKKPVIAVMRSISTSAGYMAALGADYIIAREGTITGSIGVLIETAEITELAQKLGIQPIIIKSAPLKGSPSFVEKSTPAAERVLQDVIDDFYVRFVSMVAERRQLPRDKAVALADGRVYSGRRALDNKLIDALGGEKEALEWLIKEKQIRKDLEIKDVEIEQKRSLLDELVQSATGKFFKTSSIGLDGLAAIWHPQLH